LAEGCQIVKVLKIVPCNVKTFSEDYATALKKKEIGRQAFLMKRSEKTALFPQLFQEVFD
jgi:hypothetical protein